MQVSLDAFKKTYDKIAFRLTPKNTEDEETIPKQDRIMISIDENNSSAGKEDIAELLEIDGEPIYEDVKVGKLILMAYTNLRYISVASSNNIETCQMVVNVRENIQYKWLSVKQKECEATQATPKLTKIGLSLHVKYNASNNI